MFKLNENPDYYSAEVTKIPNPYYDLDSLGEKTELLGKEALDQMIENVLLTEPNERIFNLGFGSPLYMILFENFNNASVIMDEIYNVIELWVPIKINRSNTNFTTDELNQAITFTIPYISNDGLISGIFSRRIKQ